MEKDDFVKLQRSAGQLDSEGVFTIDERHALLKLGAFQLPKPATWVLKLVQAAVAAGAPHMRIKQGVAATIFEFESQVELDVREMMASLTSTQEVLSRPLTHLTLGLRSVGIGQKRPFTLSHLCRSDSYSLVFDGSEVAVQEEPERSWVPTVTLAVRNPAVASVSRRALAEEAIARSAHTCPVPLTLDGVRLDRFRLPWNPPNLLALGCEEGLDERFVTFAKPQSIEENLVDLLPTDRYSDLRPFCTFMSEADQIQAVWRIQDHHDGIYDTPSFAFWVVDGVVVVSQPLPYVIDDSVGLHLFLDGSRQPTDLSGFKFAGDDRERRRMLHTLLTAILPRLEELRDKLRESRPLPSPKELGLATLASVLSCGVGLPLVLGEGWRRLAHRGRLMEESATGLERFTRRLHEALDS